MKTKLKIIIPVILAIAAVITAAFCISFTPNASQNIEEILSTAQKYLVEQNYEQAIAEFNKIIELDPMNSEAYLGLAQAYIDMGDTEKAVETLEKGFELTADTRIKAFLDKITAEFSEDISNIEDDIHIEDTVQTVTTQALIKIPNIKGMSYEEAKHMIEDLGLECDTIIVYTLLYEADTVCGYAPEQAIPGSTVMVYVSAGESEKIYDYNNNLIKETIYSFFSGNSPYVDTSTEYGYNANNQIEWKKEYKGTKVTESDNMFYNPDGSLNRIEKEFFTNEEIMFYTRLIDDGIGYYKETAVRSVERYEYENSKLKYIYIDINGKPFVRQVFVTNHDGEEHNYFEDYYSVDKEYSFNKAMFDNTFIYDEENDPNN